MVPAAVRPNESIVYTKQKYANTITVWHHFGDHHYVDVSDVILPPFQNKPMDHRFNDVEFTSFYSVVNTRWCKLRQINSSSKHFLPKNHFGFLRVAECFLFTSKQIKTSHFACVLLDKLLQSQTEEYYSLKDDKLTMF